MEIDFCSMNIEITRHIRFYRVLKDVYVWWSFCGHYIVVTLTLVDTYRLLPSRDDSIYIQGAFSKTKWHAAACAQPPIPGKHTKCAFSLWSFRACVIDYFNMSDEKARALIHDIRITEIAAGVASGRKFRRRRRRRRRSVATRYKYHVYYNTLVSQIPTR